MNWKPEAVSDRLQIAVQHAGGRRAVADLAGVPLTTLSDWLNGREVRVGALVALAEACGVSLEWLATGRHPMQAHSGQLTARSAGSQSPSAVSPAPPRAPTLFSWADMERLGRAVVQAQARFAAAGRAPDARALGQATALLYDIATDEALKSVNSPPGGSAPLTDSEVPSETLKDKKPA